MARFQNVRQKSKRSAAVPAANCGLEARAEGQSPSPGSGAGNLAGDGYQPSVNGRSAGATEELIERLQRHYGLPELEMAIELHRGIVRIHLSERERREGPEAEALAGTRWDVSPTVGQRSARELVRLIDRKREVLRKVIDDANEILGEASPFRSEVPANDNPEEAHKRVQSAAEAMCAIKMQSMAHVKPPMAQVSPSDASPKPASNDSASSAIRPIVEGAFDRKLALLASPREAIAQK
jgi:hypothetical protein